ncbi:DNA cytosine methyltransferase [Planktothricoides raciborskii]|uniref:DNA (cytosine-5-)-methyltransferase n=1 Tax=Planktothricoides raciborskii GIHE-MW2 TaxID=2792601 RepID=A0AAU8JDS2_9CYAN
MVNAISLFSGCGGCSLGLKQAGFLVNLAVDIDETACETYAKNIGGNPILTVDLSHVKPAQILDRSHLSPAELHLIVGGLPCQGFSSAGTKDWADPRNSLLKKFVEIIIDLKPTWFIMENVEGLLTSKEGFYLISAIASFLESGYWVRAEKIYMERYGLPQKRKRIFIVGNLEECYFEFPPSFCADSEQMSLFAQQPHCSILNAIGDLPNPPESGVVFYDKSAQCDYQAQLRQAENQPIRQHKIKSVNGITQERINLLIPGGTMKDLPSHLQHASYQKRALRRVMDGMPTEKRGGAPNGLKRLLSDQPSLTITSASPNEFIHPWQNRLLTLRECARIQSFPDWYEFQGSWSEIASQIGNAIPPLFMNLLASHIKKIATWQRRPNSQGRWLGIDATKSSGKSPKLAKMLTQLEKITNSYAR